MDHTVVSIGDEIDAGVEAQATVEVARPIVTGYVGVLRARIVGVGRRIGIRVRRIRVVGSRAGVWADGTGLGDRAVVVIVSTAATAGAGQRGEGEQEGGEREQDQAHHEQTGHELLHFISPGMLRVSRRPDQVGLPKFGTAFIEGYQNHNKEV